MDGSLEWVQGLEARPQNTFHMCLPCGSLSVAPYCRYGPRLERLEPHLHIPQSCLQRHESIPSSSRPRSTKTHSIRPYCIDTAFNVLFYQYLWFPGDKDPTITAQACEPSTFIRVPRFAPILWHFPAVPIFFRVLGFRFSLDIYLLGWSIEH